MKPTAYAFIFARGGSKGVPRKNIRLIAGKPLIGHAIECARQCRYVSRIIVSTDDEEIASVAKSFGAETPFRRPAALSGDASPEWDAWRHALMATGCTEHQAPFDIFLSVPATAPLRLPVDLDRCVEQAARPDTDIAITVRNAERHPAFNMVNLDENGYAHLAMPLHNITRRQDAPRLYDITTVAYAAKPAFILTASELFSGRVRTVTVPQERALDIDTEYDFMLADFLLSKRNTSCAQ